MRPVTTFIRHNSIKALLAAEKSAKTISKGKLCSNLFDVEPKYIGTDVRIIKETEDSTFIAKCDTNGRIVDKPFKILVTTDLHLCDDMELINKTLALLARHVEAEKPDLILFTGDVVLTDHQQVDCIQFGRFMEKMGIYWAYVFGNHEARAEKEYHKYLMLKNLTSFPHCLSKFGDPSLFGYGNFFINILSSETSIQQSIVMLDSGRNTSPTHNVENDAPAELKCYDFLKKGQIEWYKNNILNLEKEYGKFKSIMMMHIALCEYQEVMELDENENYVPTGKAEILYGGMYESIGCSEFNSGMFKAIKELGSTQAVVVGHDHINDFCAEYDGVYLVYAQCGGYNTYTMGSNFGWDEKDWMQGVTMIDVAEDGEIVFRQRFNRDYL
ncbi:MAG: metallophosphoesterase [Clostridiaceae bacterium]|nr:metallophosphoesterase [Clostridiaceae bacterium]